MRRDDPGRTGTESPTINHSAISIPFRHVAGVDTENMVGLSRFELLTPRLSSVCSNQLSYRPSSSPYSTELIKEPVPRFLQN